MNYENLTERLRNLKEDEDEILLEDETIVQDDKNDKDKDQEVIHAHDLNEVKLLWI